VRAPVHGLVKGITVTTIGAVVNPGQMLMEIVPVDRELLVEALISPLDIGHIAVGQEVTVKVATYDYVRYGHIKGTLTANLYQQGWACVLQKQNQACPELPR
jgi:adhesin transport system membrane fusion protein